MKNTLLFICSFAAVLLHGQAFTNGTVYDYNVGDTIVIQRKIIPDPGPPTTIYQVFQGKKISAGGDSVIYTVQVTEHTPPSTSTAQGTSSTTIQTWTITGLNDTVRIYHPPFTCVHTKTIDTTDFCGFPVRIIQSVTDTFPCIDGYHQFKIIEGLGVFSFSQTVQSGQNVGHYYTLVNAHKAGMSCGVIGPIPTGVDEWRSFDFDFYPNPASDQVTIRASQPLEVLLYDLRRKMVRHLSTGGLPQTFQLDLPGGIYLLEAQAGNQRLHRKLVVQ